MKHSSSVTVIRRSCLTGKVVWIYRGTSRAAARVAYLRACRKEVDRVRSWKEWVRLRKATVLRILSECTASLSIDAVLTPEQTEAARKLQAIGKKDVECDTDFYDHIMEERRRREEDKEIRNKMRERRF